MISDPVCDCELALCLDPGDEDRAEDEGEGEETPDEHTDPWDE